MLCARECPDWCIYIEGHKEKAPPRREGGKPRRQERALDRFDIDYSLCMYCGICVEVCPFDALFWSPEYEYSEPASPTCSTTRSASASGWRPCPTSSPTRPAPRPRSRRCPASLASRRPEHLLLRIIAAIMIVAAIRVVTTRNVVHAALYLVVVLAGVAAQFVLLARRVRRRHPGARLHRRHRRAVPVRHHAHPGPIGRGPGPRQHQQRSSRGAHRADPARGDGLRPHRRASAGPVELPTDPHRASTGSKATVRLDLLHLPRPFEAVSVLLLAALIGAIVLARKD
jgi:ferredoxin